MQEPLFYDRLNRPLRLVKRLHGFYPVGEEPSRSNRVDIVFSRGLRVYVSQSDGRVYQHQDEEIHSWSAPIVEDPDFCDDAEEVIKRMDTRKKLRRPLQQGERRLSRLELAEQEIVRLRKLLAKTRAEHIKDLDWIINKFGQREE